MDNKGFQNRTSKLFLILLFFDYWYLNLTILAILKYFLKTDSDIVNLEK